MELTQSFEIIFYASFAVEEVAEKYAARGQLSPMNVLWMHHFITDNTESSKRIWDKYLVKSPRLMFQRVVHVAREKQDDAMIRKLVDLLKTTNLTVGAMGNAYSCLIDVYAAKDMFEEGNKVLESVVGELGVENINRTALIRLKEGLEKSGKTFTFDIPKKTQKKEDSSSSSSSSSSSDDEPVKKARN